MTPDQAGLTALDYALENRHLAGSKVLEELKRMTRC